MEGGKMKGSQIRLKLFLDRLNIPSDISTLEDRKVVQKVVFLGQKAGADLGYQYGWYLMGPYSPELTQDYFILASDLSKGEASYKEYKLIDELNQKLDSIKELLKVPIGIPLSQPDWLELLASVVYLLNFQGETNARIRLRDKKPHLADYFDVALSNLRQYRIINT